MVVVVTSQGGTVQFNVSFMGGSAPCTNATCDSTLGEVFMPFFACNDGRGIWADGTVWFLDPIPAGMGYVLQDVNATVYGRFDCNGTENPLEGILFLEGDYVSDNLLPVATGECTCPKCVLPVNFESNNHANGWETYNYGKSNSFQFQPVSIEPLTVCLSYILVTFSYGPTQYAVTSLVPNIGPKSGGTPVTVVGEYFFQTNEVTCLFGDQIITGSMANGSIVCTSPAATCQKYPCNITVEISEGNFGFTFNQVNFTYFLPQDEQAPLLWVWVAVGVCVGSVVLVVAAGYIYAKSNTNKSARFIDEQSKLINSEKFKKYGSLHPIDISEIIIQHRIGRGSCAEVYMGSWRGTTVAIKKAKVFADDDEEFFTELAQEAEIMSALRHPNVLQFLGTASSPPELVIVMEFMSRGSLYRIIHDKAIDLPWLRMKQMALDIARGMNYLHCSDPIIIHRDLKSHNLLVDEHFKVKVCDFGLSTMVKRHLDKFTAMTPVGTPCWTAPEVLRNEPYTERADVFSFGVVLWELVTREDPYHGMPTFQIVIAVGQHNMRPIIPPSVSPVLTTLITQCWSEDSTQRPPFSEIVQRLEKM
jgi:tRNA A-37 threonylcarbamoyl transferase component Bud32